MFRPVARRRAYIHLADVHAGRTIGPEAFERTLKALEGFFELMKTFRVEKVLTVSTGVTREAENAPLFLKSIHERTGIRIRVLSGEEEARLTGKGVLHAMDVVDRPFLIFDLGGGSTEFLSENGPETRALSVSLGAAVLTQRLFDSDPPGETALKSLARHVDGVLDRVFGQVDPIPRGRLFLVGTGGTVTTLTAMAHRIDLEDICPERMNGLVLKRADVEALFAFMKEMPVDRRQKLRGLDRGKAGVILAGTVVVLRILEYFRCVKMTVSLSDILEGVLVDYLENLQH